ncbi:hypothetical protein ATANTOWER_026442 [Ataeniobius toweri]|uniref:Uncharacterized protein n=1 Tax=Ataeniobius toweri TaxID=208326 RepID=A0ABU7B2B0_9TELE|nr:hypothetical protein [Ataeniobius toweri]
MWVCVGDIQLSQESTVGTSVYAQSILEPHHIQKGLAVDPLHNLGSFCTLFYSFPLARLLVHIQYFRLLPPPNQSQLTLELSYNWETWMTSNDSVFWISTDSNCVLGGTETVSVYGMTASS